MARSSHPLVPLTLFRSRNFTVTNISTLVIYGALYVTFAFVVIFLQGTLGYSAAAAGLVGVPGTLFLVFFSSRFGKLAARYGSRIFMTAGPAIMGLGVLWFVRMPAGSESWMFELRHISTWVPPADYVRDLLPAYVVFGIGLMMMVAPLTTALMTSVPKQRSGVASAINNAISRVGPQLAGAAIFVAIAASFYSGLAARVPGLDTATQAFREKVAPLNAPAKGVSPQVVAAARQASAHSFHVAMAIAAGLLFAGAVVNWVGIRDPGGPPWIRHPSRKPGDVLPRHGAEAAGEPKQRGAPGRWRPRSPVPPPGKGK
jgi:hypothetical protein